MSIVTLPTKTDGSIGRAKTDVPGSSAPNLDYQVPAAEYERIKDRIIDIATEVGLSDGSTPGSLRALIPTILRRAGRDDLTESTAAGLHGGWTFTVSGTGSAVASGGDPSVPEMCGIGVVSVGAVNTDRSCAIRHGAIFLPTHSPVLEYLVRPSAADHCLFEVGVGNDATQSWNLTDGVVLVGAGAGSLTWSFVMLKASAVADTAAVTMPALAAGQSWRVRLSITPTGATCEVAVDAGAYALLATLATAPTVGEPLIPYISASNDTAYTHSRGLAIDLFEWNASRF